MGVIRGGDASNHLPRTSQTGIAVVSVLVACMLFSSSGASRAIIGFPGTGISFAAWRVFIGALGLLLYVASRHGTAGIGKLMRQPLTWAMGLATLLYQAAFFTGVETVGIAVGTLIALGLAPLLAGFIAWAMGLGRPAWQWAACTGTAIFGLALLTGTAGHADATGLSLLALAAACYSFFTVVGVRMVRELAVSGAEVVAVSFGIGAIIALPILVTASAWIDGPEPILAILYAGLGATTVAYLLFANGISHLSAGTVSTLTLFEPVAATVVGVSLLGETMDARGWLGCLVIIAALGLLGYFESRSKAGRSSD